jgi:hypothetical protein
MKWETRVHWNEKKQGKAAGLVGRMASDEMKALYIRKERVDAKTMAAWNLGRRFILERDRRI